MDQDQKLLALVLGKTWVLQGFTSWSFWGIDIKQILENQ